VLIQGRNEMFIQGRNCWHVEILLQLKWSWHRAKHSLSLLRVKRRSNNTTGTTGLSGTAYTLPRHLSSHPVFSVVHVTQSLVLCVCFVDRCLSYCPFFFFWPFYSLSFFDLRIPITPLVSSNSHYDWYLHSGKKWIVFIQGRNEECLFREEMNSAY